MRICGLNKTTLLDYPEHLAATVFLAGCDFRCPFCQNSSLVLPELFPDPIPAEEILSFLERRTRILEGVCVTGGEPTLQEDLPDFLADIRRLGLKVKLDTNGGHPDRLRLLLQRGLLDYVAMDIKNSPEKYPLTVGLPDFPMEPIRESAALLMSSGIPFEFRTTVVRELHEEDDIRKIGEWLRGAPLFFLQSFEDSGEVLSDGLSAHDPSILRSFRDILSAYVRRAEVRGVPG